MSDVSDKIARRYAARREAGTLRKIGAWRCDKHFFGAVKILAIENPEGMPASWEAIDARLYAAPNGNGMQPVRAIVWARASVNGRLRLVCGVGSASGCGYDTRSAAIAAALRDLGLDGDDYNCAGRGMDVAEAALLHLARELCDGDATFIPVRAGA